MIKHLKNHVEEKNLFIVLYYQKKYTYKWTCAVQSHVVQGPIIY